MFAAQDGVTPTLVPYSDDVFSTYLYTGNGSTQTISNGLDLAGKGGLVWAKSRTNPRDHHLFDSARGPTKYLNSNTTNFESTAGTFAFSSTGFTAAGDINVLNESVASWTFRKAPKFFDVITWTGNGSFPGPTISHNLGVTPGCIVIKALSNDASLGNDWWVWHRSLASNQLLNLNTTGTPGVFNGWLDSVTSASFSATQFRTTGVTYVAYLFAHDPSTTGIVQSGNFTTDAIGNASITSLGWEPQFLLVKASSTIGDWIMLDQMRGWNMTGNDALLRSNLVDVETTTTEYGNPTATGFDFKGGSASATYIYMAIRRPNKPPTSATNYFKSTPNAGETVANPEPVRSFDLIINKDKDSISDWFWADRLRGLDVLGSNVPILSSNNANAETNTTSLGYINKEGGFNLNASRFLPITYLFRRAPGFFDIVYQTTGYGVPVPHNLGVKPALYIGKPRNSATGWVVHYEAPILATVEISFAGAGATGDGLNTSDPGASNGSIRGDATTYTPYWGPTWNPVPRIMYLFASLLGVSKVGIYTGNGTLQTIDCGFTAGARFILIKRTDSTGDWYVWDSTRGIIAGIEPHLSFNSTAAEVTTDNSVDPAGPGFIVYQVAATNINVTSATYLYLAIA